MPCSNAATPRRRGCRAIATLDRFERRRLNQISAHQYLSVFEIVEEFILPFLLDHVRSMLRDDDLRVRALLQFASERVDYDVRIKGNGSARDFEEIHQTVMKTSPNYFNLSRPIPLHGELHVG